MGAAPPMTSPPQEASPYQQMGEAQRTLIGKALKALIKSAEAAQKDWKDEHDEIWKYAYSKDVNFLYQDWENDGGSLFFKAKVAKAAQFVEVVGPYLYQYNPDFEINARKNVSPTAQARFAVEEQYLDYAARVGDLYTNCRRAVNQSLIGGRGMVFTGYNQRKKCVQHVFVDARHVLDDPDATSPEERNLQIRVRQKPRWELANLYPAAKEIIFQAEKAKRLNSQQAVSSTAKTVDVIQYHEVYMRVGVGRYAEGLVDDAGIVDDSAAKYVLIEDKLIDASPWEIPFFLQDRFPGEALDTRELPGSIYPAAPMGPGMGFLRALNWSHTLILSQLQTSTRMPFVVMNHNGKKVPLDQLFKIIRGAHFDVALLSTDGNEIPRITDIIQQFPASDAVQKLMQLNGILSQEFEKATGLYDILFAGDTQTQLRTAEDAKMKDRNSRSRIEDMRAGVEKWASVLGSKGRFAARYLENSQDVGQLFGPEAGQAWGDLASPQEVMQRQQVRQQIAMQVQQQGAPPEAVQQIVDQNAPDNLVDFEQWLLEADVDIEAGSMRRKDVDQEIDVYNDANNQLVPTLLQSPIPQVQAIGLRIAARGLEVKGAPDDLVAAANQAADIVGSMMPPPPPGMAPPAGPPSGPPQSGAA